MPSVARGRGKKIPHCLWKHPSAFLGLGNTCFSFICFLGRGMVFFKLPYRTCFAHFLTVLSSIWRYFFSLRHLLTLILDSFPLSFHQVLRTQESTVCFLSIYWFGVSPSSTGNVFLTLGCHQAQAVLMKYLNQWDGKAAKDKVLGT